MSFIHEYTYDEVTKMFDDFTQEFRKSCNEAIFALGVFDETEIRIRGKNLVLPQFPTLEACHDSHTQNYHLEFNDRPKAARLGAKVAALMFVIPEETLGDYSQTADEVKETRKTHLLKSKLSGEQKAFKSYVEKQQPEHEKPPGPSPFLANDPYASARTCIGKTSELSPPKKFKRSKGKWLGDHLKDVEGGHFIDFTYETYKNARRNQSLIGGAAKAAGWQWGIDENCRTWASKVNEVDGKFVLRIFHLTEPVMKKTYPRKVTIPEPDPDLSKASP